MSADRIAVAFDAAVGHLADDGDRRALVLALVEHMPPEGVAELLARLIECHPEGAGLVRSSNGRDLRRLEWSLDGFIQEYRDGWRVRDLDAGEWTHRGLTREAAEAALIAAQPVPAAVVRVQS